MKKIIHITKGAYGGQDYLTLDLIKHIRKFDQKIIYFIEDGKKIYKTYPNERASYLEFKKEIIFVNLWKKLKDLIISDIIHVHHSKFWILFSPLFLFSKKTIYSFHISFGSGIKKNIFESLATSLLLNYCTFFSRDLIFLTSGQKELLKRYVIFPKKFEEKSKIISNFISESIILSKKKTFNDRTLFIGRFSKLKGFDDLRLLAETDPSLKIYTVGERYKTNLDNLINYGSVPHSKIYSYIDNSTIFVLPSYTEAFPMTILECMARGLVILVSDLPGMNEIVKSGRNGYLFKPGDMHQLGGLLHYLIDHPKHIKEISQNNLEDVKNFTIHKQIIKYLKIYNR